MVLIGSSQASEIVKTTFFSFIDLRVSQQHFFFPFSFSLGISNNPLKRVEKREIINGFSFNVYFQLSLSCCDQEKGLRIFFPQDWNILMSVLRDLFSEQEVLKDWLKHKIKEND